MFQQEWSLLGTKGCARRSPAASVSTTIHVENLSRHLGCVRQVENRVDDVLYYDDFAHGLEGPKMLLWIILVQWCVHDAGGYGVEADAFFCVLDGETAGHCIQAALRHHRNGGLFAGKRLIDQRRGYGHNISRFLFQHLFDSELSDVEEAQQVRRCQGLEVLGRKLREGLGAEDSGVVHKNIHGSEVLEGCFYNFAGGLLLPDIAIHQKQAGRGRQGLGSIQRRRGDVITAVEEALDQTRTNAPEAPVMTAVFFSDIWVLV